MALLSAGKRRESLALAAEQRFAADFAGHCLPFDSAAIALARHLPLATRNTRDFQNMDGLILLDPRQST